MSSPDKNSETLDLSTFFKQFRVGEAIELPETDSWPQSVHVFDQKTANAVAAALAAQRPLLIRGEPGMGKSQLARAVAVELGWLVVSHVVNARCESEDLLYHFDAVGRLGEAQALGAGNFSQDQVTQALDTGRFLSPGPIWWAFNWDSAQQQYQRCLHNRRQPEKPEDWQPGQGAVILIDEIDKADADLPNGLLETLGNGAFTVPWLDQPIQFNHQDQQSPLVIVTTNEERELPAAFIRRCMVLKLTLPKQKEPLQQALVTLGQAHFPALDDTALLIQAADLIWDDREKAFQQGLPPPGQAEYLDMLRAVVTLSATSEYNTTELLQAVSHFTLKKFA